jgi:3-oxoacyl-[acyl-carrier-protein] synthase-3
MRVQDVYVNGIGVFLPEPVSIESAVRQGFYPAEDAERYGWTGCAIAGDISAPEMALRAARDAIEHSGRDPHSLDLLVYTDCWHQGPDGWQPQAYLQHHLVGGDLLAIELRHGCNGTFSALEIAASYLAADPGREAALVVASDNFGTPLLDRWNPGPGFVAADAAAALVISKRPGFARLLSVGSITIPDVEEIHRCGEPLFPPGATTGRVVDFTARLEAFRTKLFADGTGMEAAAMFHEKTQECVQRTLAEAGIELDDVKKVIITNSSQDEAEVEFMGVLGLPLSMSTWDYGRTIGHMGAGDHTISLRHLLQSGQIGPGDHVLMIGTAPGLTYSCAVLEIRAGFDA